MTELHSGEPRVYGNYTVLRVLGHGGMGDVFLARSPSLRLVAIKVIRTDLANDASFRARMAREVEAAMRVGGMFIAPVVDAELDVPRPWVATEYVDAPSLYQVVGERGPLPGSSLALLAAGLAEGLRAIHRAGVVHRDLTPGNVLLAEDGPRIIDFGIALAPWSAPITQAGVQLGTPGYMSPEQARGEETGPASDIFSLGAVLTYAARGKGPFAGTTNPTEMIYQNAYYRPDVTGVPEAFRALLQRCMQENPQARPSPGEVLAEARACYPLPNDLEGWLKSQPFNWSDQGAVTAAPPRARTTWPEGIQPVQRPVRPGPRHALRSGTRAPRGWVLKGLAGGGAVLLALAIGLVVAFRVNGPGPAAAFSAAYTSLAAGDCLTGAGLTTLPPTLPASHSPNPWPDQVDRVSCRQPHLAEVYYADAAFWSQQAQFPGSPVVISRANAECDQALLAYDGVSFTKTEYTLDALYPGVTSWAEGDRSLQCLAVLPASPKGLQTLTSSLKGTHL